MLKYGKDDAESLTMWLNYESADLCHRVPAACNVFKVQWKAYKQLRVFIWLKAILICKHIV